jgi:hypothetical protein
VAEVDASQQATVTAKQVAAARHALNLEEQGTTRLVVEPGHGFIEQRRTLDYGGFLDAVAALGLPVGDVVRLEIGQGYVQALLVDEHANRRTLTLSVVNV